MIQLSTQLFAQLSAQVSAQVSALLTAGAVVLLVPGPRHLVTGPHPGGDRRRRLPRPGPGLAVALVATALTLLLTLDGRRLALGLIVLGVVCGVVVLVARARAARAAERRQAVIVEVCEALAGELRAGQPLVAALDHSSQLWRDLETVVAAARLGADVPTALRRLADLPGADGLREVAAAWQVSEQSGAGLSTALSQVAGSARERQGTRHLVTGELASAQATARLVALLPLASLAMSAGIGGDPWHFLLATPIGLGCLAAGLGLAFAGLLWIDRIAAGVLRG